MTLISLVHRYRNLRGPDSWKHLWMIDKEKKAGYYNLPSASWHAVLQIINEEGCEFVGDLIYQIDFTKNY